jgi:hypothetical protein
MKCWGLVNPHGNIVWVFKTQSDAWFEAFQWLSRKEQDKLWKLPGKTKRYMTNKGWSVWKCRVVFDLEALK